MKYVFVAVNGLALVALGLGAFLLSRVSADPMVPSATVRVPATQPIPPQEQARLDELATELDRFALFMESAPGADATGLLATAQEPPDVLVPRPDLLADVDRDQADEQPPAPLPRRQLSVVLDGPRPTAVVDGRVVQEGDRLPGEAEVLRIDTDSVVIAERGGRRQRLVAR